MRKNIETVYKLLIASLLYSLITVLLPQQSLAANAAPSNKNGEYTNLCGNPNLDPNTSLGNYACEADCNPANGQCKTGAGQYAYKFTCPGKNIECGGSNPNVEKEEKVGPNSSIDIFAPCGDRTVQVDVFNKNCRDGAGKWVCSSTDLKGFMVWHNVGQSCALQPTPTPDIRANFGSGVARETSDTQSYRYGMYNYGETCNSDDPGQGPPNYTLTWTQGNNSQALRSDDASVTDCYAGRRRIVVDSSTSAPREKDFNADEKGIPTSLHIKMDNNAKVNFWTFVVQRGSDGRNLNDTLHWGWLPPNSEQTMYFNAQRVGEYIWNHPGFIYKGDNDSTCGPINLQGADANNLSAGQTYNITLNITNTGINPWKSSYGYNMGSALPRDNFFWGSNRISIPNQINTNETLSRDINVTVPTTPGNYNLAWQMVKDTPPWQGWFGPVCSIPIHVNASQGNNHPPSASIKGTFAVAQGIAAQFTATAFEIDKNLNHIQLFATKTADNNKNWFSIGECVFSPTDRQICDVTWTPSAAQVGKTYYVTVNAENDKLATTPAGPNQAQTRCTGNPWRVPDNVSGTCPAGNSCWVENKFSDCGSDDFLTVFVGTPPAATIGNYDPMGGSITSSTINEEQTLSVAAIDSNYPTSSLKSGDIWIANTDKTNPCSATGTDIKSGPWCQIATTALSGGEDYINQKWTPTTPGTYYIAVNATNTLSGNSLTCSGNPWCNQTLNGNDCPAGSQCESCGGIARCNADNNDFITFTVTNPPPLNVIPTPGSCSNGYYNGTIAWTGVPGSFEIGRILGIPITGIGYWVDISTDNAFSGCYYHKFVPATAGTTAGSTTMSDGFNAYNTSGASCSPNMLTLGSPYYYARVNNGVSSGAYRFQKTCPLPPTVTEFSVTNSRADQTTWSGPNTTSGNVSSFGGQNYYNEMAIQIGGSAALGALVTNYYVAFYNNGTTTPATNLTEIKTLINNSQQSGFLLRYNIATNQASYWKSGLWRSIGSESSPIAVCIAEDCISNHIYNVALRSGSSNKATWVLTAYPPFGSKNVFTSIQIDDDKGGSVFYGDYTPSL